LGKEELCTHFRSLSERKGVEQQYGSALLQIPWNLTRDFINALCEERVASTSNGGGDRHHKPSVKRRERPWLLSCRLAVSNRT